MGLFLKKGMHGWETRFTLKTYDNWYVKCGQIRILCSYNNVLREFNEVADYLANIAF